MAMSREEIKTLIDSLSESTDGTRLDDYAVLVSEMNELADDRDRLTGRVDELEVKNGELKKENFKLFSRVGAKKEEEIVQENTPPAEDEKTDFLKDVINDKGRWI